MNFDDLINNGWARHDKESAALATDLEEHHALADTPQRAVALLGLSNHTVGYHMKDWPRALRLCERVIARFGPEPALSPVFGSLAIAQFMAGDEAAALASECKAVELSAEPLSAMVRTRVLIARELADAMRLDEAAKLYEAAVALARSRTKKLGCDRAIAVTSNNLAGNLLEKQDRAPQEDAMMLAAAEAAREFWMKSGGTWENEERAEYLLALVKNALGRPDEGLKHALKGLEVIAANGPEKVDEAFLNLAVARAYRLKGNGSAHKDALARADALAAGFGDKGLADWFAGERTKVLA
jgi:tetratricopeptide (TPR) repeat protein